MAALGGLARETRQQPATHPPRPSRGAMDWGDVRVFLAVAREGSMRAAGRALGLRNGRRGKNEDAGHHARSRIIPRDTWNGRRACKNRWRRSADRGEPHQHDLRSRRCARGRTEKRAGLL
jgi:hypothetical protein